MTENNYCDREDWSKGAIESWKTVMFSQDRIQNNQYWVSSTKDRVSVFRSRNDGSDLFWTNIKDFIQRPLTMNEDRGFLFDNYWLALGYFLRLRENLLKQQEEKNETKRS